MPAASLPWSPMPLLALLLVACSGPPAPATSAARIAALPRSDYAVPALGIRVSMLRGGDPAGRRVILVHGTPGDAAGWADFIAAAPPGQDIIAIDRPGFGSCGPDGAVVSLRDQAAAIEPLLVRRDGRWPILVGHSLGGPIVAQAAADFPGRVGALIIVAGSLDPAQEHIHWAQPIGEWRLVRGLLPRALRNANRELMALKPQLEALAPRLSALRCPVEVVHGTKDQLVPYANVAFLRARMPAGMAVTTLEGRNHFLPWTSAGEIRAAIARAAARADAGAPC